MRLQLAQKLLVSGVMQAEPAAGLGNVEVARRAAAAMLARDQRPASLERVAHAVSGR
jgi:hypothetical protein